MNKILVIGANGLFGSYLCKYLVNKNFKVFRFKKKNTNLSIKRDCKIFFSKNKFDIIINLAAITNVDRCEKYKKKTFEVNTQMLKNIRYYSYLFNNRSYLIFFSTDQFYSNYRDNFEKTKTFLNYYTKTKYLSESYLKNTNSIIIRTNFFGKSLNYKKRKSFTDFIYFKLINNKQISLAHDIKFSPISMNSLCRVMIIIIKKKITGIYNIGSKKGFSKFEFGIKFAKKLKLDTSLIKKVSLKDLKLFAKRPKDMRMQVSLFEKKFKFKFNLLDREINKVVKNYEKKS